MLSYMIPTSSSCGLKFDFVISMFIQVMFFAERHINPGEEITYDYHFNREDEGQRILCFCRSRYCRRYLN
jgi:SET domain-containing protein|uniref:SET domain-containing protein n=1 Tax=Zea mays TaxID=4577 RepID=B6TZL3_MAIZE|nr:hypothetical protein [Zea mays]